MSKPPEARIDRRRVRTRSALIKAGQALFASRSIDGVTIDDIVETADVAKGSFYNHFDDKESLADAVVEMVQNDCEKAIAESNQDIEDSAIRVARAMATLIRYAQLHPDRYRSMINLAQRESDLHAPINAGLRQDIANGLENNVFSGVSIEAGMLVTLAMISKSVDYLVASRKTNAPETVALEMSFMLLRALGVSSTAARAIAQEAVTALFRALEE